MASTNNVIVGPATLSVDGSDVGFTQDGVAVRNEREYVDVVADQIVGKIKKAKSLEAMFVKTTLLEATTENLYIAWDLPDGSLGAGFGNLSIEREIVVVGPAPVGLTRTYTFYRAVSIGNSEVMYSREAPVAVELEFEVLKNSLGKFGTMIDA